LLETCLRLDVRDWRTSLVVGATSSNGFLVVTERVGLVHAVASGQHHADENTVDVSQMEKLWDAHASCITLLHCQLVRTGRLVRRFPLIANCT